MASLWDEVGSEFSEETVVTMRTEEEVYQKQRKRDLFKKSVDERVWIMIKKETRRVAGNPGTFGG